MHYKIRSLAWPVERISDGLGHPTRSVFYETQALWTLYKGNSRFAIGSQSPSTNPVTMRQTFCLSSSIFQHDSMMFLESIGGQAWLVPALRRWTILRSQM
jgi:hypothetical protein